MDKQVIITELIEQMRKEVQLSIEWGEAAAKAMGLHSTDSLLLGLIHEKGAVTAGQLAAYARRTTGATSVAINRLERAGLVKREADSVDRRKTIVKLTALPPHWQDMYTSVRAELRQQLAAHSLEELQLLKTARKETNRLLQEQIERVTSAHFQSAKLCYDK